MRKSTDAVSRLKDDAWVFLSVGATFWAEKKPAKARRFLSRATELDPDNGDAWIYLYHFERENGQSGLNRGKELPADQTESEKEMATLKNQFIKADPRHGLLWPPLAKAISNHRLHPWEILTTCTTVAMLQLPKYF